jgi:hypothetical protein
VAALKKRTLCHFSANLWHFSALQATVFGSVAGLQLPVRYN